MAKKVMRKYSNGGGVDLPLLPLRTPEEEALRAATMENYKLLRASAIRGSGVNTGYIPFTEEDTMENYKQLRALAKRGVMPNSSYKSNAPKTEEERIISMQNYKKVRNNKLPKYALGSPVPEDPSMALTRNQIAQAKAAQTAANDPTAKGLNMFGNLAMSVGQQMMQKGISEGGGDDGKGIAGFLNKNQGIMNTMFGAMQGIGAGASFALGGVAKTKRTKFANGGVPINAEGGEVVEVPGGEPVELDGASHANGGINMEVPAGTEIYSQQLKGPDGRTMASRKKSREGKEAKLGKTLQVAPTDKLLRNAYKRTKQANAVVDAQDMNKMKIAQMITQMGEAYAMGGTVQRYNLGGNVNINIDRDIDPNYYSTTPEQAAFKRAQQRGLGSTNMWVSPSQMRGVNALATIERAKKKAAVARLYPNTKISYGAPTVQTPYKGYYLPTQTSGVPVNTSRVTPKVSPINKQRKVQPTHTKKTKYSTPNSTPIPPQGITPLSGVNEMHAAGLPPTTGYGTDGRFIKPPVDADPSEIPDYTGYGSNNRFLKPTVSADYLDIPTESEIEPDVQSYNNSLIDTASSTTSKGNSNKGTPIKFNLNDIFSNVTAGDALNLYGQYKASTDPLKNTRAQRAADTPNINAFKDYGKRGLNELDKSKGYLEGQRASALGNLNLDRVAASSRNRAGARGINTLRALDIATDAQAQKAKESVNNQFNSMMAGIFDKASGMMNQQDQMVMQGEQGRDAADRADKDAYYSAMARDIATKNTGMQYMGKNINEMKTRKVTNTLMNKLYPNFKVDGMSGDVTKGGITIAKAGTWEFVDGVLRDKKTKKEIKE